MLIREQQMEETLEPPQVFKSDDGQQKDIATGAEYHVQDGFSSTAGPAGHTITFERQTKIDGKNDMTDLGDALMNSGE